MKFLQRTLIAVVLIAVVVAAIVVHPLLLTALVLTWVFLASREYALLIRPLGAAMPWLFLALVNLIFPLLILGDIVVLHRTVQDLHWAAILLPIGVLAGYSLFAPGPRAVRLGLGSFGVVYLSMMPTYLILLKYLSMQERTLGVALVFFPLVATWVNDTGAYVFGRWLGRHKLSPEISPNKTWEGFIAGVLVTGIGSAIALPRVLPGASLLHGALLGLVLGVVAQAGDLVESIFKREAGVKDSSSALGAHGGFLDRADSLVFVLPVFYYFVMWFLRMD